MKQRICLLLFVIVSLGAIAIALRTSEDQNANFTVRTLTLPDHGKGNVTMDYIAYDPATGFLWVPAINIGVVYVVDTSNDSIREIPDFATKEVEFGGRKRMQGPSGVSVGDGVVYIGDRADSSICAIDAKTVRKTCGHIDSTPDGVVYVALTNEVWVTAPRDNFGPHSGQPIPDSEGEAHFRGSTRRLCGGCKARPLLHELRGQRPHYSD